MLLDAATFLPLQQSLAKERPRIVLAVESMKRKYSEQKRALEAQLTSEENSVKQQIIVVEGEFESQRTVLSNEERQARAQSEKARDESDRRFQGLSTEVIAETEQLHKSYTDELDGMNQELEILAKHVREISWSRDQASRARVAYARFTFGRYCLRVLGG